MESEIKTSKYIWRVSDEHGWALEGANLREFNINFLESIDLDQFVEKVRPNLIHMTIADKSKGFMSKHSFINVYYTSGYLKINEFLFQMKFSETDEFISKLIRDNNNFEVARTSDINRDEL